MQILVRSTTILLEKCYFGLPFSFEDQLLQAFLNEYLIFFE